MQKVLKLIALWFSVYDTEEEVILRLGFEGDQKGARRKIAVLGYVMDSWTWGLI